MGSGLLANVATVSTGAGSNTPLVDLVRYQAADNEGEVTKTLRFQLQQPLPTGTVCLVTVTSIVGNGASFVRYAFASTAEQRMQLSGISFIVTAQLQYVTFASNAFVETTIAASLSDAAIAPLQDLNPTWVPGSLGLTGLVVAPIGGQPTTPGFLLNGQGCVTALGSGDAGPYWVMFFDQSVGTVPANGTAPLVAIGPIAAGASFSFEFGLRPSIRFANGLSWALSTTAGSFTGAGVGAQARVDVGYGQ